MGKHRAATALSLTALAVAVLGQTPLGHAAVSTVRVALFAQNRSRQQHPGVADARPRSPARARFKGALSLLGPTAHRRELHAHDHRAPSPGSRQGRHGATKRH